MAKAKEQPTIQAEEAKKLDETIPGGFYIVDGRPVDCNGKPIKDSDEEIKEV